MLVSFGFLAAGCSNSALGAHPDSVFQLRVGDCLNPPSKVAAQVVTVSVIPCNRPHTQEVFALVKDAGPSTYPGAESIQTVANAKCLQYFAGYVGVPYQRSSLFYTYLLPSVRSWEAGDRTITCIITTTGQRLTSSVKGSKR